MGGFRQLTELPWLVRRNISLPINHALIRKRESDQYIVAFPRSGSTWLRTVLAALIDREKGFEPAVFNRLIPSVGVYNLSLIGSLPDPRLIFSHTVFRHSLRRVVYLVRDGRDSIVSFYHMETTRSGISLSFPEWFNLYCLRRFGPRWDNNVESWLTHGRDYLRDNMLFVKFEELKKDPVSQIQKITSFLNMPSDEQAISRALDAASIENAREREKLEDRKFTDPNASFYRGGKTGQWRDYLDDAIYARFLRLSRRALQLAGYPE
jgi:hypothetical protein